MPIEARTSLPVFNEVVLDTPFTMTPAAGGTAEPLTRSPYKWVTSVAIRVRSMGTATYLGIGNRMAQEYRLIGVNGTYSYACNPGEVINLSEIWILSDTNDGVLEVVASYLPVALYGNVNQAIGQR